jgi:4-hydroxybenzoate polyprenyltransferase
MTVDSPTPSVTARTIVVGLVRACHPEPSVAVTAMAVALAFAGRRTAPGVAAVGLAVLAGQLSVGWHNDWLDAERDRAAARPDKPVAQGAVGRATVGRAAGVALVAVVPLSLLSGWRAAAAHLAAVGLAWGYNARLKATVASFVPYALAFPLLLAFVSLGQRGAPWPPWWALLTAALLGSGAHLVNAAPDIADDLASGVAGLPQRLGYGRSVAAAAVLLLAATVVAVTGPGHPGAVALSTLGAASLVVALAAALGRRPGSRWLFRAAMLVALIDVAALVAQGRTVG